MTTQDDTWNEKKIDISDYSFSFLLKELHRKNRKNKETFKSKYIIPIILESPYAGETQEEVLKNTLYAQRCLKDSLDRGEAPFASHLLYTQVLDDNNPDERKQGMEAGQVWGKFAEKTVVYCDHGISEGMQEGIDRADEEKRPIEKRYIYKINDLE